MDVEGDLLLDRVVTRQSLPTGRECDDFFVALPTPHGWHLTLRQRGRQHHRHACGVRNPTRRTIDVIWQSHPTGGTRAASVLIAFRLLQSDQRFSTEPTSMSPPDGDFAPYRRGPRDRGPKGGEPMLVLRFRSSQLAPEGLQSMPRGPHGTGIG